MRDLAVKIIFINKLIPDQGKKEKIKMLKKLTEQQLEEIKGGKTFTQLTWFRDRKSGKYWWWF
ncbi:hypothetical protein KIMC2_16310 [Xylocopilactobacillus apis]|uniref:Bacteriocin-type signal sequence-containing protein n=1 Tax=Xylocopilactobacillus apis TaxID=2932183 RepID=A0AAU9D0B0_9LACO|nr:hypothetical protein KIMC2_16310 [Xylocopilactobacillus apis]